MYRRYKTERRKAGTQLRRTHIEYSSYPWAYARQHSGIIDIDDKRVLFGQDIHGPYIPEWGAGRKLAAVSVKKLIDLKADILCEGHFGVYQPAEKVKRYIEYYMDIL